ncbi:MAG: NAD(P)H-dependent oxidoreductase subunit E [Saprospiraceae bacterium]|nr:NAD(P)H-dependent oxidoreductase subunit E [Saprospiraceae bacterium]
MKDRFLLLDELWKVQRANGHLPTAELRRLAEEFDLSEIEIEGVASFYHFFHFKPAGRHTIYLNHSILSEFQGLKEVREAFERATLARLGSVDPSGEFGLFETSCVGLSDQEPAALIDFMPVTNLTPDKARRIVQQLRAGLSPESIADEVEERIYYLGENDEVVFFRPYEPGRILRKLLDLSPEEVIEQIRDAQLAGMGGAFFPTGTKWDSCRNQPGFPKYIVCNADEGEPGTFKDRVLMDQLPGLLFEGMAVAGYAVGASSGILYLRAEYGWLLPKLEGTLTQFRERGWLGRDILGIQGFHFDIRVQVGAGAYVCGEETALLESLEGKRGEPRTKQYFPTERGYMGLPTVVNNVETLCAAARVIELGSAFFGRLGTPSSCGHKLLSVAGDCSRPGVYEIEWGLRVSDLLEECGATNTRYVQLSGPSGTLITAGEFDRQICHEDLSCGGSVMIFDDRRDLLQILRNFAHFFRQESCGVCTPCRAGNLILTRKLRKLALGLGDPTDLQDLRSWGALMKASSRCGLGKNASNALLDAIRKDLKYFRERQSNNGHALSRGFDLKQAVQIYEKFKS